MQLEIISFTRNKVYRCILYSRARKLRKEIVTVGIFQVACFLRSDLSRVTRKYSYVLFYRRERHSYERELGRFSWHFFHLDSTILWNLTNWSISNVSRFLTDRSFTFFSEQRKRAKASRNSFFTSFATSSIFPKSQNRTSTPTPPLVPSHKLNNIHPASSGKNKW